MVRRRMVLFAPALLVLAACKVLPIAGEGAVPSDAFDARAYAAGLWSSRALPHFQSGAHPIGEVLSAIATGFDAAGASLGYRPATEGSPWTFVVSGTGVVSKKNTKSRAGTLEIAVDGTGPTVSIQIGPVVRGNAIRDALPFVSFKDFTNQLEFAEVGKALTALAMEQVAASAASLAEGNRVQFLGALSLNKATDPIVVTPVSLGLAQ